LRFPSAHQFEPVYRLGSLRMTGGGAYPGQPKPGGSVILILQHGRPGVFEAPENQKGALRSFMRPTRCFGSRNVHKILPILHNLLMVFILCA
jgi:hypothetical protein